MWSRYDLTGRETASLETSVCCLVVSIYSKNRQLIQDLTMTLLLWLLYGFLLSLQSAVQAGGESKLPINMKHKCECVSV